MFESQRQMARPSLQHADMSVPLSPSEQVTPIFDDMHSYGNMMHMRTTLILDDTLIAEARRLTGLTEKTAIVHAGLQALISRESARRFRHPRGGAASPSHCDEACPLMVLVDTSVWIDHLRRRSERLAAMLEAGSVACHSFVIGELACGHLARREELLGLLQRLPAL